MNFLFEFVVVAQTSLSRFFFFLGFCFSLFQFSRRLFDAKKEEKKKQQKILLFFLFLSLSMSLKPRSNNSLPLLL